MSSDWKQDFANQADKALRHPLIVGVMDELKDNLGVPAKGLESYGIAKVAHYAAMVARAQALGIDPDLLRATAEEADEHILSLARMAAKAGVPTLMVDPAADPEVVAEAVIAHLRTTKEGK